MESSRKRFKSDFTREWFLAIENNDVAALKELYRKDFTLAVRKCNGTTALQHAAARSSPNTFSFLLSLSNRDVNQRNDWCHATPLRTAAMMGNVEIVQLLLQQPDINIHAPNHKNESILTSLKYRIDTEFKNQYTLGRLYIVLGLLLSYR